MSDSKPTFAEFKRVVLRKDASFTERRLGRPLSTRITWTVLKVFPKATPNQASIVAFLVGLYGILVLAIANGAIQAIIGASVIYLWSILDGVDGEIARFKNMTSKAGYYLDVALDPIIVCFGLLGMASFTAKQTTSYLPILIGITIGFAYWIHRASILAFLTIFTKLHGGDKDPMGIEVKIIGIDSSPHLWKRILLKRPDRWITFGLNMALLFLAGLFVDTLFGPQLALQTLGVDLNLTASLAVLCIYLILVPYAGAAIATSFLVLKKTEREIASTTHSEERGRELEFS